MSIIYWPFDKWLDNVALAALSTRETVQASYDIARLAIERGVPGDFVECGVFGGAQCAAFARAIYAELHRCDEAGADLIVIEAPPESPEWSGIADRLRRASA